MRGEIGESTWEVLLFRHEVVTMIVMATPEEHRMNSKMAERVVVPKMQVMIAEERALITDNR